MADKIGNGNLAARKGAGRPKGSLNKVTASAKAMIEECAAGLGGSARLIDWAREAPENERAFWATIFPKLMPVQLTGDPSAPLMVAMIERHVIDPKN